MRRGPLPTISTCTVSFSTQEADKTKHFIRLGQDILCSFLRMPRAPQHPHDYYGGFPLCGVYWPDLDGCVEGAGISPRPERGGQV